MSVIRNAAGEIKEIQKITEQKAQEYQDAFLAEERGDSLMENVRKSNQEELQNAANKYDQYKPYGITYSAAGEALYFNGQRVKLLFDQDADGWFTTSWTDDAGTLNLEAVRDASGQITAIESISDEIARKYIEKEGHVLDGLEERVEERVEQKMKELYPEH